MRRFFARLSNLFLRAHAERELDREVRSHLALLQEDLERRGVPPQDASLAARRAYGGIEQAKELHRETRSFLWIEQWLRDLRFGTRNLLHTPTLTAVVIITLALGIGANTAIFTVVNAVLLRPLPYRDSGRLVTILHTGAGPVAPANYFDWRDQSRSFSGMAAAEAWGVNLTNSDSPEHLVALHVTTRLLPMLGVDPVLGRLFIPSEGKKGSEREVVLSYQLWRRHFNLDPNILGKLVTLNGLAYTIVGVMPPGFQFAPFWATRAELWAPLVLDDRLQDREGRSLRVFARLKPDVSLAAARAEMQTITGRLDRQFPSTNRGVAVTPLIENVVGKIEPQLLLLLGAVAFVLLIACANVANMLLARTADRQKEIAVRTALGAGRARVISQFLTENLLLAVCGAVAGLLLAQAGTKALVALSPAYIPRVQTITIDAHVALFLLGITLFTTLVFGLAPALHAATADSGGSLKETSRGQSDGPLRARLRGILVASEVALAFTLLIGAGLMTRSFATLQSLDPGFNPHHVLSMVVSVSGTKEAEPSHREALYRQLLSRIRNLPGVPSAGAINHLPLAGDLWGLSFVIEGRPKARPGEGPMAVYRIVMPGYFNTMRLPLRSGRDISIQDDSRAPGVVVINERAARQYWPGEDPVGKRIAMGDGTSPEWLTVIGVAANAKQSDWASQPDPEVYLAALQNRDFLGAGAGGTHMAYITLVIRASGSGSTVIGAVKSAIWSLDPNLPISEVQTMDDVVAAATAQPRFEMLLLGGFAVVALLLAVVGIYGVMNYSVSRRTKEVGIRVALGASAGHVTRMVVGQGMMQALAGLIVGFAGSLLLSRTLAKMLYGVKPNDPITFTLVTLLLGLAALIAASAPARRAARVEPLLALRHE